MTSDEWRAMNSIRPTSLIIPGSLEHWVTAMSRLQQGLSKLNSMNGMSVRGLSTAGTGSAGGSKNYDELKKQIHARLVERLDFTRIKDLNSDALRRDIRRFIKHPGTTENPLLNR